MIPISDAELHQAFQREYPEDLGYVTRCAEDEPPFDFADYSEGESFNGKRWEDIGADMLQEDFDIACFLTPQAFHYFFPAFIKQSQIDLEKTGLLVDSLINKLADCGIHWPESMKDAEAKFLAENPIIAKAVESVDEKDLSAWRQKRWKLFTQQQWELIRRWLNWMNQNEKCPVDRDYLRKALKNAEAWQRKQVSGFPYKSG